MEASKLINRHVLRALSVLCGRDAHKPIHVCRITLQVRGQMRNLKPVANFEEAVKLSLQQLSRYNIIEQHGEELYAIGRSYGDPEVDWTESRNRKRPVSDEDSRCDIEDVEMNTPATNEASQQHEAGCSKLPFADYLATQPPESFFFTHLQLQRRACGGNGAPPPLPYSRFRDIEPHTVDCEKMFQRMFHKKAPDNKNAEEEQKKQDDKPSTSMNSRNVAPNPISAGSDTAVTSSSSEMCVKDTDTDIGEQKKQDDIPSTSMNSLNVARHPISSGSDTAVSSSSSEMCVEDTDTDREQNKQYYKSSTSKGRQTGGGDTAVTSSSSNWSEDNYDTESDDL